MAIWLLVHLCVLLTFGYAAPILGIMIIIALINECILSKLLTGRYISYDHSQSVQLRLPNAPIPKQLQSSLNLSTNSPTEEGPELKKPAYRRRSTVFGIMGDVLNEPEGNDSFNRVDNVEMVSMKVEDIESNDNELSNNSFHSKTFYDNRKTEPNTVSTTDETTTADHKQDTKSQEASNARDSQIDATKMEHIDANPQKYIDTTADSIILENDMSGALQGVFSCSYIVFIVVSMFWGCLFFDMIADIYDVNAGIATSVLYGMGMSLLIYGIHRKLNLLKQEKPMNVDHENTIEESLRHILNLDSILCISNSITKTVDSENLSPINIHKAIDVSTKQDDDEVTIELTTVSPFFK